MASENDTGLISAKDGLLFIPAAASALALCWEVGSFFPIGSAAFSFFTITEHIAFAAPALPIALLVATGFFVSEFIATPAVRLLVPRREPVPELRTIAEVEGFYAPIFKRLNRISRAADVANFLMAVFWLGIGIYYRSIVLLSVGCIAFAVFIIMLFPFQHYQRRIFGGAVLAALLLALAVGADYTRFRLNHSAGETIEAIEGPVSAVILRAGERGILLYQRETEQFSFKKWDAIKGIGWKRKPILKSDNSP